MALWNVWNWDPWSQFEDLERRLGYSAEQIAYPAINVYESGDAYGLEVEAPGVDPKDLELTVEGNVVTVSGARPEEKFEGAYHRQERPVGRFARSVSLPTRVDPDHVEAQYADGVLTARLAKAPEARARKIAVKPA